MEAIQFKRFAQVSFCFGGSLVLQLSLSMVSHMLDTYMMEDDGVAHTFDDTVRTVC